MIEILRCVFQDLLMEERCGKAFHHEEPGALVIPPERGWPEQPYCPQHATIVRLTSQEQQARTA